LSIELTIKPLELGGGYKYRMLDMLCVEALEIGIVRMLLKRQQLFSTGYGVSASLTRHFSLWYWHGSNLFLSFLPKSSGGCKG